MNNKMKIIMILLALALASLACSIQKTPSEPTLEEAAQDELIVQERPVEPFTGIIINGGGWVDLIQGEAYSLTIEAEAKVLERLTSEVKDGNLILGVKPGLWTFLPSEKITYTITFPQIEGLGLNGGASINSAGLVVNTLQVDINGGADIHFANLSTDKLVIKLDGGANFEVNGSTQEQQVQINGAANYQAGDLKSDRVVLKIIGAGNAVVWAVESFDLEVAGTYSVSYYGDPVLTQQVTGVGKIESLGEK